MDIQTRKLQFIEEFLRTANINILERFEEILREERKKMYEEEIKPMSLKQYEQRVNESIVDYKKNKVTSAKKLKKDISSWK